MGYPTPSDAPLAGWAPYQRHGQTRGVPINMEASHLHLLVIARCLPCMAIVKPSTARSLPLSPSGPCLPGIPEPLRAQAASSSLHTCRQPKHQAIPSGVEKGTRPKAARGAVGIGKLEIITRSVENRKIKAVCIQSSSFSSALAQ